MSAHGQYSYNSAAVTQHQSTPAGSYRGISPVTHMQERAASQSPGPGLNSYNPAIYQGGPAVRPLNMRRPSASPMRAITIATAEERGQGEQYNPQNFGPVSGNGGAFVPNSGRSEEAPPPYSPAHNSRQPPLHVHPPHHRQPSWARNTSGNSPDASPSNSSAQPTPSSATAHGIISPYSTNSVSTAGTTPLSPGGASALSWFSRRSRAQSPAANQQTFAPSSLQQSSVPVPPSASRNTSAHSTVPPPPPGPPPAGNRSASVSTSPSAERLNRVQTGDRSASVSAGLPVVPPRSESRATIPPPPPGPPPAKKANGLRQATAGIVSVFSRPRSKSNGPPSPRTTSTAMTGVEMSAPSLPTTPLPTTPASPPVIPPKRKIEDEGGSYRERQRASPKQIETENRQRVDGGNNPWRNGISERASPPRLSPPLIPPSIPEEDKERSPLIELVTPASPKTSQADRFRRKGPTLNTRQQLPTPPPGHSSPTSPGAPSESIGRAYTTIMDAEPGPSAPRDLGKGVMEYEASFLGITRRRYKDMLVAEDVALTDADKLNHFLVFLTKECQLRSEMYSSRGGRDDLRKLGRIIAVLADEPVSPVSPDDDMIMMDRPEKERRDSTWWKQSTGPLDRSDDDRIRDIEESSRGRTSSRWWETSGDGGSQSENLAVRSDGFGDDDMSCGYGPRRAGRNSKTPRASLREIAEFVTSPRSPAMPGLNGDPASFMGSAAFPPDRKSISASRSRSRPAGSRNSPRRTVKTSLDIAPLLTLLPTQPREYPAINNAHPDLEVFRTLVRTLNQLDSLKTLHDNFNNWHTTRQTAISLSATKRRNTQAERIQTLYSTHTRESINFSTVEALNIAFEDQEAYHRHSALQEEFDEFSSRVVDPAHRDLHERITAATAAYTDLKTLIATPTPPTPTATPTSSTTPPTEPPELLEQLTALKWLFDVRESLHKHVYDLLSLRNTKYKALVLAPLLDARATSRIASAETFFTADESTRRDSFAHEQHTRAADFSTFVDAQVTRAVEAARSKYWDAAPLIQESLTKIPDRLQNVVPIVPPEEFVESPELLQSPMLYLERMMRKAEESVYALVEEQTELLCLLHGVKTFEEGGGGEERLTRELKEQVMLIEDEWKEGLGGAFKGVRERVAREVRRLDVPS